MFYQVDGTRLPLRDYLRECLRSRSILAWIVVPAVVLPVVLVRKLLRIRHLHPAAISDTLEPFLVDPADIPEDVREKMEPLEADMRTCGFVDPVYHWIVDPFTREQRYFATFRHPSGATMGSVELTVHPHPTTEPSPYPDFSTAYRDGTYYTTTSKPAGTSIRSPMNQGRRFPNASVSELWRLHGQYTALDCGGKSVLAARSREDLLALLEKARADECEYLLARGVLVPRTEAEQQIAEAVMATPGDENDRAFAAVYAEIEQLADRKASSSNGILLLIITVAAFFALGRNGQTWKPLALIAAVIFFHELGHLAAMWLFRYRNLRMFFIPFLGAAVSGQNYNVPGWKKAIVSLMGPLPGIVLGAVLGVAAAVGGWPELMQAAFLLLLINAFNLLPVMPLDGGQAMHAVLFSRHPMFDVAFRAIAGVVLVLGYFVGMMFLAILGVFMLLGLPANYRTAKVIHRLRQRGFDATSPDARTIPMETARVIHDELIAALPAGPSAKVAAQMTLQGFELLNARPPSVLASLALVGLHAASLLAAVVMVFALIVVQRGAL